jgi:hypothetical protein
MRTWLILCVVLQSVTLSCVDDAGPRTPRRDRGPCSLVPDAFAHVGLCPSNWSLCETPPQSDPACTAACFSHLCLECDDGKWTQVHVDCPYRPDLGLDLSDRRDSEILKEDRLRVGDLDCSFAARCAGGDEGGLARCSSDWPNANPCCPGPIHGVVVYACNGAGQCRYFADDCLPSGWSARLPPNDAGAQ